MYQGARTYNEVPDSSMHCKSLAQFRDAEDCYHDCYHIISFFFFFYQGKENLVLVSGEFELSEFELSRFYCNNNDDDDDDDDYDYDDDDETTSELPPNCTSVFFCVFTMNFTFLVSSHHS